MRRLLRILLNAAMVLSLVLCAATVVLWVRGYSVSDELAWTVGEGRYSRYAVMTEGNVLVVVRVVTERDFLRKHGRTIWFESFLRTRDSEVRPASFPHHWGRAAGLHVYSNDDPSYKVNGATISMWLLFTVWLLSPACWFVRWRARARTPASAGVLQCDNCGYDLRATPERCPECGRVPGAADAIASAAASDATRA